jgi:hypothetical protein
MLITPLGLYAQTTAEVADDENVVELSPFEVTGDTDVGYQATSTLAGTRLRTDMRDIGSSISIINEEFMNDTGSLNLEDVLVFTPNTEVGGLGGNFTGSQGFGQPIPALQRDQPNGGVTRIRGLAAADLTRDYFVSDIPFDAFNTDRVEVQRGANSALFGLGSPGGIVNASTIKADFLGNRGRARFETDQYGTIRASARYNVMAGDILAVRVAALYEDKGYEQKQAFRDDERYFAAMTLNLPWGLTVRGSAETASRFGSNPDFIPPNDAITPWLNLGKFSVGSPAEGGAIFRSTALIGYGDKPGSNFISNAPGVSSGYLETFGNPSSPLPTWNGTPFVRRGEGLPNPFGSISGSPGEWMLIQPRTENEIIRLSGYRSNGEQVQPGTEGFYSTRDVSPQIVDRSIFDYRENLFSGGHSQQHADWEVFTASIEGNYFDNRLGFTASFYQQDFASRSNNTLQGNLNRSIYIDPNEFLIGTTDGTGDGPLLPNPNYGRPVMGGSSGGNDLYTNRESSRVQAYYDLQFADFMDEDSWVTKLLGHFTLTGLVEKSREESKEAYGRDAVDWTQLVNVVGGGDTSLFSWANQRIGQKWALPVGNDMNFLNISSIGDLAGANIGAVPFGRQNFRPTPYASYTAWSPASQAFVEFDTRTFTLNDNDNGSNAFFAGKSTTEVDSQVMVGQSYLWDGMIVLTGTWRNDVQSSGSVGVGNVPGRTQVENVFLPSYVAGPQNLAEDADEDTTSWSVMVHTPEFLAERLPFELSVYASEADNFQPAAGRVTVWNDTIAPITGTTEEKGIIVEAFDGKVSARFNWYETSVQNTSFDIGGISPYAGILTNLVRQLGNPDNISQGFTEAQSRALLAPQGVQDVSGFVPDYANLDAETNRNSGDNGTQDFTAEGMEVEIAYNPTPSWTMLFTVGQQETVTSNTYPELGRLVDEFVIPTWINNTDAQNFFINNDATETLAQQAQRNIVDPYNRGRLQDGNPSKEQAEWRWAFNTSYSLGNAEFIPNWLGDLTVGGGMRWEDQVGIGFGAIENEFGAWVEDLNQPFFSGTSFFVDVFARMRYQLDDNRSFSLQINIKDLMDNSDLKPFAATPDGNKYYRFTEGRLIALSGTLEF